MSVWMQLTAVYRIVSIQMDREVQYYTSYRISINESRPLNIFKLFSKDKLVVVSKTL